VHQGSGLLDYRALHDRRRITHVGDQISDYVGIFDISVRIRYRSTA
jgi:hypothetical protein